MAETPAQKPDVETLRRAMAQLGVPSLNDDWLERLASELEGLLKVVGRLDELDLSQVEPARIFMNRDR